VKTETTTERELAALLRLERAARKVLRFPGDRQPIQSLSSAVRNLDRARREETE
jgi:hypothetical protein